MLVNVGEQCLVQLRMNVGINVLLATSLFPFFFLTKQKQKQTIVYGKTKPQQANDSVAVKKVCMQKGRTRTLSVAYLRADVVNWCA